MTWIVSRFPFVLPVCDGGGAGVEVVQGAGEGGHHHAHVAGAQTLARPPQQLREVALAADLHQEEELFANLLAHRVVHARRRHSRHSRYSRLGVA